MTKMLKIKEFLDSSEIKYEEVVEYGCRKLYIHLGDGLYYQIISMNNGTYEFSHRYDLNMVHFICSTGKQENMVRFLSNYEFEFKGKE